MRNLRRISGFYNRSEAWRDWYRMSAIARGWPVEEEIIAKLTPVEGSSWKVIDKATAKLRSELESLPKPAGQGSGHFGFEILDRNQERRVLYKKANCYYTYQEALAAALEVCLYDHRYSGMRYVFAVTEDKESSNGQRPG